MTLARVNNDTGPTNDTGPVPVDAMWLNFHAVEHSDSSKNETRLSRANSLSRVLNSEGETLKAEHFENMDSAAPQSDPGVGKVPIEI
jgi:hypothetical protein